MRHHRYFENNLQHDAQELLNVFLDMLHEDLNRHVLNSHHIFY